MSSVVQDLHGGQQDQDPASDGDGHQAAGAGQTLLQQHRGAREAPDGQPADPGQTPGGHDGEVPAGRGGPVQSPAASSVNQHPKLKRLTCRTSSLNGTESQNV